MWVWPIGVAVTVLVCGAIIAAILIFSQYTPPEGNVYTVDHVDRASCHKTACSDWNRGEVLAVDGKAGDNLLRLVAAFSLLVRAASEACAEADMIRERLEPCHGDEGENLAYVVRVLEDGLDNALDMVKCGAETGSTAERA